MSDILQTTTQFNEMPVRIFRRNNQLYMTGEELGRCLGFSDHNSVRKVFERHQDELEPHTVRVKLTRTDTAPSTRLYSEVGCYLVSMFARTPRAKEVRLWLATLPGKLLRRRIIRPSPDSGKALRLSTGEIICYRPPRSPKYEENRVLLEQLLKQNQSGSRIAKELGVSRKTVYQWIRKLNIS